MENIHKKKGATSNAYTIDNKIFVKFNTSWKQHQVYEREKFLGTLLNKFDWYPKLLFSDDSKKLLIFNYAGEPLTKENAPKDVIQQFNNIISDLEKLNIQHNDITEGELLVLNDKLYLCDFGWGTIANELACNINLWDWNSGCGKPYGIKCDSTALYRLNIITNHNQDTYKDPNRIAGSQSEVPSLQIDGDIARVYGYHEFAIHKKTKSINLHKKKQKFIAISQVLANLNKKNHFTFCDIGCSAGLASFIAHTKNYKEIWSLDHDHEYIDLLTDVKHHCNITNIYPKLFSFGDTLPKSFDVVLCGAIIHWIFSLTADFRNFDSIIQYLLQYTNKFLLIEWISPDDHSIGWFQHIKKRQKPSDEPYTTQNFELSIKKCFHIEAVVPFDTSTRTLYILKKLI